MKKREFKNDGEVIYIDSGNALAIRAAQEYLNENGYTDGYGRKLDVDGDYGINTYNAIIKFQEDNGLLADGKLGDDTWNTMWDKEEAENKEWQKNSMWTWDRKNVNNKEKAETEKVIKEKEKESEEPGWFTSFMMSLAPLINNGKYGVNNLDEVEQKERENALRDKEEPITEEQDPFELETSMGDRVEDWFN